MRKVIGGDIYLKHIIELWIGDWEEQPGNIHEPVRGQNEHQQESGNTQDIRKISKKCSGNVLGTFFWKLPTGRKDTGFGRKVTNLTKVRTRV